ncbi:ExbD/TolR family protein [Endozoicomonas elysicola]|uniref:ExbD/TolR family protein n=1 Tax=Endozoicomonas elysicola TaxID=305900 RepID=UPI0003718EA7|nr:biopolymer transporter ExbD [Endozoicomonas elysicola]
MIHINDIDETSASLSMADLTPLLDVVFIVMVFLLFTANVQTLSLPVELPQATQQEVPLTTAPKTLTVSILEAGEPWAIGEQKYDQWEVFATSLLEKVKEAPDTTVLIAGDKDAPLGNLVKLMMFLSQHKIEAAQVLMEQENGKGDS